MLVCLFITCTYKQSIFSSVKVAEKLPSGKQTGKHVREISTPLNPTFILVKLGYAGVYLIFFFLLIQNIGCGYSLESPR